MNFNEYLYAMGAYLTAIGSGGLLVFGLSSWLGKVWANRILAKERSKFQQMIEEHKVRFSALHEKQAFLIAELYQHLRKLDYGVRGVDFWLQFPSDDEQHLFNACQKLSNAYVAAREHYESNQIYFNSALCNKINEIIELSSAITNQYYYNIDYTDINNREKAKTAAMDFLENNKDPLEEGIRLVEKEFRGLLGVI